MKKSSEIFQVIHVILAVLYILFGLELLAPAILSDFSDLTLGIVFGLLLFGLLVFLSVYLHYLHFRLKGVTENHIFLLLSMLAITPLSIVILTTITGNSIIPNDDFGVSRLYLILGSMILMLKSIITGFTTLRAKKQ